MFDFHQIRHVNNGKENHNENNYSPCRSIHFKVWLVGSRTSIFDHCPSHPSILNELLVPTRGASLRGISRRTCLRRGSSLRSGDSLRLSRLVSGPSNLGPYSIELSEVLCCISCSQVTSPTSQCRGPLLNLGSKTHILCSVLLWRLSISSSRAACSCQRARSSLLANTQNTDLVKRVNSAVPPTSESMINPPLPPTLGREIFDSLAHSYPPGRQFFFQMMCVDGSIDFIVTLGSPGVTAHSLILSTGF